MGGPEEDYRVELHGLDRAVLRSIERLTPEARAAALEVRTDEAQAGNRPAVLGSLHIEDGIAVWRPRYPLVGGQSYTAVWRGLNEASATPTGIGRPTLSFTPPLPDLEHTTVVTAVYPSGDEVPANLLRVYIQFSAPMSREDAARYVELLDASGEPIEGAFVLPERELWSPAGDRLTLFFDPGRIKQDVGPNLQVGAPLREGQEVVLRVTGDWSDARGASLHSGFEKRYRVVGADRVRPDPAGWELTAPSGAHDSVVLELPESLDRGLLERMIVVETGQGIAVAGTIEVDQDERRWRFRPERPWRDDEYVIRVDPLLEDLAGNSIERLFDEPLDPDRVGAAAVPAVRLRFSVGRASD